MAAPVDPVSNLAYGISLIPFVLLALLQLRAQNRVASILRENHPADWEKLDQPESIFGTNAAATIRFYRFMLGNGRRDLADPQLDRAARRWMVISIAYLAYVPLLFAWFLVYVWYIRP